MSFVTVIVPVRNEARSVERTLRSLLAQDYPAGRFEVIVADGGSTDDTVPIVRRVQAEYANLHLVYNPDRFSSAGRNLAVRHMAGDVAVVVDGHCHVPDKQYLSYLVDAFRLGDADCLGRPQPLDAPNPTPYQQAVAVARHSRLGHNPDSDIYSDQPKFVPPQNTAIAYCRTVFHQIGLFDQQFDACEDVEFNHRVYAAGLSCYFDPRLKIAYHPRGTWRGLFVQLSRYGAGRAKLSRKHPRSLTLPALIPPAWGMWVAVGLMFSLLVPSFGPVYAISLGLYVMALLAAAAWLGRGQPAIITAHIPAVFLAIHFGFAWGFVKEMVRPLFRTR
ncbi:MAG TPA: glycosyltransferase family 2 protein [Fimbriiglobus sp.]|jgi:glycosyltransferase involved in cell wall biosynthesis